ncbi:YgcG family protein [Sorangium cellulosum]|uniref:TPM domain-containing protein n=1 Tax=Sorangium cellulosum TaxID=56 RepID=UPI003D9AA4AD
MVDGGGGLRRIRAAVLLSPSARVLFRRMSSIRTGGWPGVVAGVGLGRGVRLFLAAALGVLVMLFIASPALAAPAVTIEAAVNDHAGVLTQAERDDLTRKLLAHRERTGVQIAVLLVRTTGGVPIEEYSLAIAEAWSSDGASSWREPRRNPRYAA